MGYQCLDVCQKKGLKPGTAAYLQCVQDCATTMDPAAVKACVGGCFDKAYKQSALASTGGGLNQSGGGPLDQQVGELDQAMFMQCATACMIAEAQAEEAEQPVHVDPLYNTSGSSGTEEDSESSSGWVFGLLGVGVLVGLGIWLGGKK